MALIDEHSARRTAQGLGSRRVGLSVLTVTLKRAAFISRVGAVRLSAMDYRARTSENYLQANFNANIFALNRHFWQNPSNEGL
jgi:hypothetical protein